ncbi:hypothetical protein MAR_012573 [Mya arenaria]|uniref:Uncharacterized protein n=1 Tax=Mya arenaria TaxID=6604 RepID=A0ABY7G0W2_MYAAR|nr:hypothetical protein MAR_012573 [Mya arenaria]
MDGWMDGRTDGWMDGWMLLDKRENELLEEIDRKKRESETLLNEMKANCLDMKTATEKLKAELQAKEVNNNQLFVSGTRAIKELVGLQSSLDDIRRRDKVPHSKFSRDPATGQLLYSNTAVGRVDQVASDLADQQKQPQRPGESTSAVGQQGRQQQKEQQPRQLETMQQQQKHMQGVSQKVDESVFKIVLTSLMLTRNDETRDFHRATLWMDMTLWRVMFRLSAVSIEFPDVYILYRLGIVVTINSAAPRLGKKTFDLLMTFPRGFR